MIIRNKKIGTDIYVNAYTLNDLIRKYKYSRIDLLDNITKENWFNCDDCGFYYDANFNSYSHKNRFTGEEKIICCNCADFSENLTVDINRLTETIN